ncbi:MAG: hypothetical protein A2506_07195 [Elusimicrobia bacterium RIFOXYD12_FULL_66_9]|nr:MAG: hypothetical protein A2506_07195 [Elusimicrobia bacterium RIFOXYD12_FULL_66_9]
MGILTNNVVRRVLLYGGAAALIWGGARMNARLSEQAARPEPSTGPTVVAGRLDEHPLHKALLSAGFGRGEAEAAATALARRVDARRLSPLDRFRAERDASGRLLHLTFIHGQDRVIATPGPDGKLRSVLRHDPLLAAQRRASGMVKGSLWVSMESAGVPAEVIVLFAETFQWTVDFLTEPRDGDRFAAVWTERGAPGRRVLSRTFEAGVYEGRMTGERTALLFDGDYFDAQSESLQRMFLRAPLKFARVSSGFSKGRFHPVLRINRPHHGTDYAASRGTPVSTVADGVVVAVRRDRGFGNYVKIKHDKTYTSLYGHLSRFGNGIRQGVHVKQGRVIGYVGSTGLATGPHLHFQIEKNGRWADFLKLDLPFARSVPRARRAAFAAESGRLLPELRRLARSEDAAAGS